MSQDAEIFRTRLGRFPHKARAVASFHYTSAPHMLEASQGETAMRTWYIRDKVTGDIEGSSLRESLVHLDKEWAVNGPFDGVLGKHQCYCV